MVKIGFLADDIPNAIKFKDDKWHRFRPSGLSTFNFAVSKSNPRYQNIKFDEACYFSFIYKDKTYLFSVIGVEDSSVATSIRFETVDNSAEIVYEEAPAIDNKDSHDLIWYLETSGITGNGQLKIGVNELAGVKRTLKYEGTTDTKITRLQDIMASFDAEFEFETVLSDAGPIKESLLHIYREHDDNHQGVGRRRDDLPPLMSETGLEVVERDIDYKGIWTAVKVTGKDNLNFTSQSAKIYNTDGIIEFEKVAGDQYYRAVLAARLFPSNAKMAGLETASYREKTLTTEYDKQDQLMAHGLKFLQANAYPKITFSAQARSSLVRSQRFDLDMGDTWRLQTDKIRNDDGSMLILEFRIDEIEMSFTNPSSDKFTFSNFKKLKSQISNDLQAMVDKLVAERLPYTLDLATDNGTVFKNGAGNSLVTPTLKKGAETISDASFVWHLGADVQTAKTYSISAEAVNGTQVVTVEAMVGGQVVATSEITFTNVTDGQAGANGHTLSATITINGTYRNKTLTDCQPNLTVYYDNQRVTSGFVFTAKYKGAPFGDAADNPWTSETAITVATNGNFWSFTNGLRSGSSLLIEGTVTYQGLSVKVAGRLDNVNDGQKGSDGLTYYPHVAYANSADGRTDFSLTDSTGRRYQGTYHDTNQNSSTDPTKYKWVDMVGPVKVGGTNLFTETKYFSGTWSNAGHWQTDSEKYLDFVIKKRNVPWLGITQAIQAKIGEEYTFSCYVKSSQELDLVNFYTVHSSFKPQAVTTSNGVRVDLTNEWQRISITFKVTQSGMIAPRIERIDSNAFVFICAEKLELGNIATAWSPAPEDIDKAINSKADQVLTQAQLIQLQEANSLLENEIKARLTQQALLDWAEEYNKTVTASTDEAKAKAEDALKKSAERLAEVTELGEKAQKWETTTGYIQADDDGLTIAKDGSDTKFIVTNDVISFVSGGKAVMTLTKGELKVDNGVFALSVRLGRFVEAPLESNSDINVIRYVGEVV